MNAIQKIAAGLAALTLVGVIGLTLYLTPERVRALIVPGLESSLDRKVTLDAVDFSVWSGLNAELSGLTISEREGFGNQPFVSTESGRLSLSLLSLIFGGDEIGDLTINRPQIRLAVNEAGEANYADLLSSSSGESAAPPMLPITRFRIVDGSLIESDRRLDTTTRLTGVDYDTELRLADGRLIAEGGLEISDVRTEDRDGTETAHGGLAVEHALSLSPAEDVLEITSLLIASGPIRIGVEGRIARLSSPAPELDLKVSEQTGVIDFEDDSLRVTGSLDIDIRISGSYDPASSPPTIPTVDGHVKSTELHIEGAGLPRPFRDGVFSLLLTSRKVTLETLSGRIGKSDVDVSGTVTGIEGLIVPNLDPPRLTFRLASDLVDLDELATVPAGSSTASSWSIFSSPVYAAAPVATVPSPLVPLARLLDVDGGMKIKKVVSGGTMTDLSARMTNKKGKLSVHEVKAKAYGGQITGDLRVDLSAAPPHPGRVRLSLRGGQADGILQSFFDIPLPLAGKLQLDLAGSGAVDPTLSFDPASLSLAGLGTLTEGLIQNWGWLKGAAGGMAQLDFLDFDRIPLKNVRSQLKVENGRLYTRNLTMTAADIPCRISGSTGILDGTLDYTIDMKLPADRISIGGVNVGSALGSLFGGSKPVKTVPVKVKVGGTTEKPQFSIGG